MPDNSQPDSSIIYYMAFGGFWILLNAGLIGCTLLKESEIFWRNEGGYPVGLREAILALYYPYLIMTLFFQATVTAILVHACMNNPIPSSFMRIVAMAPAWLLSAVAIALLLANNVMNVINGRPFHWHNGGY